jgi:hypothetical protein
VCADDEVRVVRSAQQKRATTLNNITEQLKDAMDDHDYLALAAGTNTKIVVDHLAFSLARIFVTLTDYVCGCV